MDTDLCWGSVVTVSIRPPTGAAIGFTARVDRRDHDRYVLAYELFAADAREHLLAIAFRNAGRIDG